MNALIRKELRSIFPAWLLAMLLAVVPVWIVWPGPMGSLLENFGVLVFGPFALGAMILALEPFGYELNCGTFTVLLSQPVSRRRLWCVKTVTLAAALVCVFFAFWISTHWRVEATLETLRHTVWRNAFERQTGQRQFFLQTMDATRRAAFWNTLQFGGLALLAAFSGGLWTTLLFRQVTAALWVTILAPVGLVITVGALLRNVPEPVSNVCLAFLLILYSVAGYVWASRFFLRVQDTQWTGGVISLPNRHGRLAAGRSVRAERRHRPIRALIFREFQSQQVNLMLAGGLLLVHLGVVAVRHWGSDYLSTHRSTAMVLEMIPLLWLVIPLLVGSLAVAEERKLGTFQNSLCLPSSYRAQFLVKLGVTVALGLFFGAVVPLVIERALGAPTMIGNSVGLDILGQNRSGLFLQLWGAVGLTLLAFYGSTLSRNSLQAMGAALLACCVIAIFIFAAQHAEFPELILWRGRLISWIAWPCFTLMLLILGFRNSVQLQPGPAVWSRNVAILLATLGVVGFVTTTVYHRAWEAWIPEEPLHSVGFNFLNHDPGTVRSVPQFPVPARLYADGPQRAVVLPDGRLWMEQREATLVRLPQSQSSIWLATGPVHKGFVDGSNWKEVAVTQGRCFAIQRNGTLWDVSTVQGNEIVPQRVGEDNDWSAITGGWEHFCALKTDNTLWQWGWRRHNPFQIDFPIPEQVGTDNDWLAICDHGAASAAIKADGSVWRWAWSSKTHPEPVRWLNGSCSQPVSVSFHDPMIACVCADGTLWIGGEITNTPFARVVQPGFAARASREMVRWGNDNDWEQIHFVAWHRVVALKALGSLWEWDLRPSGAWFGGTMPARMPSHYTDWLAIADDGDAFIALARDGSLCQWGEPEGYRFNDWMGLPDPRRWLMPSRIKATRVADLSK